MKIRTCTTLLIALLTVSLLAGCSAEAVETKLDAVEDAAEQRLDTVEDAVEAVVIQPVTPEPTAPAETQPLPDVPQAAEGLTAENAQAIALEHAGLTADQVTHLRAEFDRDDGIPEYDVEFRQDRWEYEYEIHAETGAILSAEKDWDD